MTALRSSPPSSDTVSNPTRVHKSSALFATNPRATAMALAAWFTAGTPIAYTFTVGVSFSEQKMDHATWRTLLLPLTLKDVSIRQTLLLLLVAWAVLGKEPP